VTEPNDRPDSGSPLPSVSRCCDAPRKHEAEQMIYIELSPAQVGQILSAAAENGSYSLILAGLGGVRYTLERIRSHLDIDANLSSSLLCGLLVIAACPQNGSDISITELARMIDMNPSTTHRYVTTLVVAGLLERDPVTRKYRRPAGLTHETTG
jgi:DNA-binding MarR family transcriptional regulator